MITPRIAFAVCGVTAMMFWPWQFASAQSTVVPKPNIKPGIPVGTENDATRYCQEKLRDIILPRVQFSGASLEQAMEYLRIKVKELYANEKGMHGLNAIIRPGTAPSTARITVDLRDVPLGEALRYITELAGMKFTVEQNAVVVTPSRSQK